MEWYNWLLGGSGLIMIGVLIYCLNCVNRRAKKKRSADIIREAVSFFPDAVIVDENNQPIGWEKMNRKWRAND